MSGVSYLRPFAFEQLSPTEAGVTSLTEATFTQKINNATAQPAREASISVEDAPIRFRIDGGNPTQTVGHLVPTGTFFTITTGTSIKNFKAMAIGAPATAKISITYFQG